MFLSPFVIPSSPFVQSRGSPELSFPLSLSFQGEGCFRHKRESIPIHPSLPRKRESGFVLLARLLLCRRECGQDNEVLLVGSLTDQDDG
jgi:hypothetical protein